MEGVDAISLICLLPFKWRTFAKQQPLHLQLYGNAEIFLAFRSNAVAHGNISVDFKKMNLIFAP